MAMTEQKREVLRLARKIVEKQREGDRSICSALSEVGIIPDMWEPAHDLRAYIEVALECRGWLELWQREHIGRRCIIGTNLTDRLAWIDWLIACPTDDELALAEACANGWDRITGDD